MQMACTVGVVITEPEQSGVQMACTVGFIVTQQEQSHKKQFNLYLTFFYTICELIVLSIVFCIPPHFAIRFMVYPI